MNSYESIGKAVGKKPRDFFPPCYLKFVIFYLNLCDTIEAPSTFKNCLRFPHIHGTVSLKIPVICCSKSVRVTSSHQPMGKTWIYIFSQLFANLSHK